MNHKISCEVSEFGQLLELAPLIQNNKTLKIIVNFDFDDYYNMEYTELEERLSEISNNFYIVEE